MENYNYLIRVLGAQRKQSRALKVLERMTQDGPSPDEFSYTAAITACGHARDADTALQLLHGMSAVGLPPDGAAYGAAMDALVRSDRLSEAFELLNPMQKDGVPVTVDVWTHLLAGCYRAGDLERAWDTWDHMNRYHCEPDAVAYSVMISACARADRYERANNLYEEMLREGVYPTHVTYNAMIYAAGRSYRPSVYPQAHSHFQQMKAGGFAPDLRTYNAVLLACSQAGDVQRAKEYMKEMAEAGVRPSTVTFNTLLSVYARALGGSRRAMTAQEQDEALMEEVTEGGHLVQEGNFEGGHPVEAAGKVHEGYVVPPDADGRKELAIRMLADFYAKNPNSAPDPVHDKIWEEGEHHAMFDPSDSDDGERMPEEVLQSPEYAAMRHQFLQLGVPADVIRDMEWEMLHGRPDTDTDCSDDEVQEHIGRRVERARSLGRVMLMLRRTFDLGVSPEMREFEAAERQLASLGVGDATKLHAAAQRLQEEGDFLGLPGDGNLNGPLAAEERIARELGFAAGGAGAGLTASGAAAPSVQGGSLDAYSSAPSRDALALVRSAIRTADREGDDPGALLRRLRRALAGDRTPAEVDPSLVPGHSKVRLGHAAGDAGDESDGVFGWDGDEPAEQRLQQDDDAMAQVLGESGRGGLGSMSPARAEALHAALQDSASDSASLALLSTELQMVRSATDMERVLDDSIARELNEGLDVDAEDAVEAATVDGVPLQDYIFSAPEAIGEHESMEPDWDEDLDFDEAQQAMRVDTMYRADRADRLLQAEVAQRQADANAGESIERELSLLSEGGFQEALSSAALPHMHGATAPAMNEKEPAVNSLGYEMQYLQWAMTEGPDAIRPPTLAQDDLGQLADALASVQGASPEDVARAAAAAGADAAFFQGVPPSEAAWQEASGRRSVHSRVVQPQQLAAGAQTQATDAAAKHLSSDAHSSDGDDLAELPSLPSDVPELPELPTKFAGGRVDLSSGAVSRASTGVHAEWGGAGVDGGRYAPAVPVVTAGENDAALLAPSVARAPSNGIADAAHAAAGGIVHAARATSDAAATLLKGGGQAAAPKNVPYAEHMYVADPMHDTSPSGAQATVQRELAPAGELILAYPPPPASTADYSTDDAQAHAPVTVPPLNSRVTHFQVPFEYELTLRANSEAAAATSHAEAATMAASTAERQDSALPPLEDSDHGMESEEWDAKARRWRAQRVRAGEGGRADAAGLEGAAASSSSESDAGHRTIPRHTEAALPAPVGMRSVATELVQPVIAVRHGDASTGAGIEFDQDAEGTLSVGALASVEAYGGGALHAPLYEGHDPTQTVDKRGVIWEPVAPHAALRPVGLIRRRRAGWSITGWDYLPRPASLTRQNSGDTPDAYAVLEDRRIAQQAAQEQEQRLAAARLRNVTGQTGSGFRPLDTLVTQEALAAAALAADAPHAPADGSNAPTSKRARAARPPSQWTDVDGDTEQMGLSRRGRSTSDSDSEVANPAPSSGSLQADIHFGGGGVQAQAGVEAATGEQAEELPDLSELVEEGASEEVKRHTAWLQAVTSDPDLRLPEPVRSHLPTAATADDILEEDLQLPPRVPKSSIGVDEQLLRSAAAAQQVDEVMQGRFAAKPAGGSTGDTGGQAAVDQGGDAPAVSTKAVSTVDEEARRISSLLNASKRLSPQEMADQLGVDLPPLPESPSLSSASSSWEDDQEEGSVVEDGALQQWDEDADELAQQVAEEAAPAAAQDTPHWQQTVGGNLVEVDEEASAAAGRRVYRMPGVHPDEFGSSIEYQEVARERYAAEGGLRRLKRLHEKAEAGADVHKAGLGQLERLLVDMTDSQQRRVARASAGNGSPGMADVLLAVDQLSGGATARRTASHSDQAALPDTEQRASEDPQSLLMESDPLAGLTDAQVVSSIVTKQERRQMEAQSQLAEMAAPGSAGEMRLMALKALTEEAMAGIQWLPQALPSDPVQARAVLVQEAKGIYAGELAKARAEPDIITLNTMVSVLARAGRPAEVYAFIDQEFRKHGQLPDERTFRHLVTMHEGAKRMDVVEGLVDLMLKRGLTPSEHIYGTMIHGYAREYRIADAIDVVKYMKERNMEVPAKFSVLLRARCKELGIWHEDVPAHPVAWQFSPEARNKRLSGGKKERKVMQGARKTLKGQGIM